MTAHAYRTHTCGELRITHINQTVKLSGWVNHVHNLGGILFIHLRDHYGFIQVVVTPTSKPYELVKSLGKETVITITGTVAKRPDQKANPNWVTGAIEVIVDSCEVIGTCDPLPMNVFPEDHMPEDVRLTNRFLDLRRTGMHERIKFRSEIIAGLRMLLQGQGFTEFQTPILTASSPEGARDFLVPSRLYPNEFYALPQAPQQFKQLLMVSGFDRYFQIAPCFRDESGRADRTPGEFYQLDMEMSFVTQEDVFAEIELIMTSLFSKYSKLPFSTAPFQKIKYKDSIRRFGTDKPDLRIPFEITDLTHAYSATDFVPFQGKKVQCFVLPEAVNQPRSWINAMEQEAIKLGASGLAYLKVIPEGITGSLAKSFPESLLSTLPPSCLILAVADSKEATLLKLMGLLRTIIAESLKLIQSDRFEFAWIVDYPMYERTEENTIAFSHNPFSMPQGGLKALQEQEPTEILAYQYDLVCNGYEIASGAIRNHVPEIMYAAFELAGYSKDEVDTKFGGMINAFRYGAPPHGGIAPGIERLLMLLTGTENIREVIAFPMTQAGRDLLMGAPSKVTDKQLKELHLKK